MPRAPASQHVPPKSLMAKVRLRGREFAFKLYHRPLRLGPAATVQYYWMDSSQFRSLGSDTAIANFRNCVGHWWHAMRAMGWDGDLEEQIGYVTALCYALLSKSKGLQDVYRDAHLAPSAVRSQDALPDELRERVRGVVQCCDRFAVRRELDEALGRFAPPAKVLPLLQEAFRRWVGKGVVLMRAHGNDGLEAFLGEVNYWLAKYRKKGGHAWVRHFINLFAYEAKVSFYRCYANAWIDLIPWLREHQGLDVVSERFLRFWHHQNQAIAVPHGRTPGGVYYPTHGRATLAGTTPAGATGLREVQWQSEHLGPTHIPDVFSGQVLSLHPLSGFFMKDSALCAVAGKFFASADCDLALRRGQVGKCSEYWNLVGAILTAAHLYRRALDRQSDDRGVHVRNRGAHAGQEDDQTSEAALLNDFAQAQDIRCPKCQGALSFHQYQPASEDDNSFQAEFHCRGCRRLVPATIMRRALESYLLPDGGASSD